MSGSLPPFQSVPPTIAAKKLFVGVESLLNEKNIELPFSFLAAQTLECALKAFLSKQGVEEVYLKRADVRHNLERLWVMSHKKSLGVTPTPPQWCTTLNSLHNGPRYFSRYPTGLNAMQYPVLEDTKEGVNDIFQRIESFPT